MNPNNLKSIHSARLTDGHYLGQTGQGGCAILSRGIIFYSPFIKGRNTILEINDGHEKHPF
jgi:hypothetical protein